MVLVGAISFGTKYVWDLTAARMARGKYEAKLAELRRAGEPTTVADLKPKAVPDEDNAAVQLERLRKVIEDAEKELAPINDFVNREKYRQGDRLSKAGLAFVRNVLKKFPDLNRDLKAAVSCPHYASKDDFSLPAADLMDAQFPRLMLARKAGRLLDHHGRIMLDEDNPAEACEDAFAILKLARQFEREPFMMPYLASLGYRGVACALLADTMNVCYVGDEMARRIEKELSAHDDMSGFQHALRTERAAGPAYMRKQLLKSQKVSGYWNSEREFLEILTAELELGPQPAYLLAQDPRMHALATRPVSRLTQLMLLGAPEYRKAIDRTRAHMRCVRVALALQAHAIKNGTVPDTLEAIDLPADARIDPFTGESLLVDSDDDDGWLIYSVGHDGEDDGGSFDDRLDVGIGPMQLSWPAKGEGKAPGGSLP